MMKKASATVKSNAGFSEKLYKYGAFVYNIGKAIW
jgi:hypothetical protein